MWAITIDIASRVLIVEAYNSNDFVSDIHFVPLSLLAAIPTDSPNKVVTAYIRVFVAP